MLRELKFSLTCSGLIWGFRSVSLWASHLIVHYHLLFYNNNCISQIEALFYQLHFCMIYIYFSKSVSSFLKWTFGITENNWKESVAISYSRYKRRVPEMLELCFIVLVLVLLEQMNNHPGDYLEGEGILYFGERYFWILSVYIYIYGKKHK